jgi:carbonic anhydrase/acetyltransferase-like protein (isoleucine patch superfamily)
MARSVHVADEFPALVGELVTVGHDAIIHACMVGNEVLVGRGVIILDGAEIGARSIIGARALVTAGLNYRPARSFSDRPAKSLGHSIGRSRKGLHAGRRNMSRWQSTID